jgi:hypothetical protein
MTDEKVSLIDKRIERAMLARKNVGSSWGKIYWDTVIAYLIRQANRLN